MHEVLHLELIFFLNILYVGTHIEFYALKILSLLESNGPQSFFSSLNLLSLGVSRCIQVFHSLLNILAQPIVFLNWLLKVDNLVLCHWLLIQGVLSSQNLLLQLQILVIVSLQLIFWLFDAFFHFNLLHFYSFDVLFSLRDRILILLELALKLWEIKSID